MHTRQRDLAPNPPATKTCRLCGRTWNGTDVVRQAFYYHRSTGRIGSYCMHCWNAYRAIVVAIGAPQHAPAALQRRLYGTTLRITGTLGIDPHTVGIAIAQDMIANGWTVKDPQP
jgi:hypothetical protein